MQNPDKSAAATGMMFALVGLGLSLLCPPAGAIVGCFYAVKLAVGLGIAAKLGLGAAGVLVGFAGGKLAGRCVEMMAALTGAVAAICVRKFYKIRSAWRGKKQNKAQATTPKVYSPAAVMPAKIAAIYKKKAARPLKKAAPPDPFVEAPVI